MNKKAKITRIDNVHSIKFKRLSWLKSKKTGHRYSVIVNGKEKCYSCAVDRIVLKHINCFVTSGLFHVQLYSTEDLITNNRLCARITEYPDREYSVIYIYNPELDKREKLIDRLLRENNDDYTILAKVSYLIPDYHKLVNKTDPNRTVCPECNVDDFAHLEGCKIRNKLDKWWESQKGAGE